MSANPSEPGSHEADIGRAAFWVHLRQDIHVALLLQVPINTDYPPCLQREKILSNLESITDGRISVRGESVDCAWANSMASILVDVINYSFQEEGHGKQSWITLRGRLDLWSMCIPRSMQPYYEKDRAPAEGRTFPEVWFLCDYHMLAWIYYHTAIVLLKTHHPHAGSDASLSQSSGSAAIRDEVLQHSRIICGIVSTNPNAQALIVLCHIATVSAVFFTDKSEQSETIKLLDLAHAATGHPLRHIKERLYRQWDHAESDT